jgi:hypothetical protein
MSLAVFSVDHKTRILVLEFRKNHKKIPKNLKTLKSVFLKEAFFDLSSKYPIRFLKKKKKTIIAFSRNSRR